MATVLHKRRNKDVPKHKYPMTCIIKASRTVHLLFNKRGRGKGRCLFNRVKTVCVESVLSFKTVLEQTD